MMDCLQGLDEEAAVAAVMIAERFDKMTGGKKKGGSCVEVVARQRE